MSNTDNKDMAQRKGELSDQQLDGVAGGQEVRKMGTIVVTAQREKPNPKVVKMETIVVTAEREKPDLAGAKLASADPKARKD